MRKNFPEIKGGWFYIFPEEPNDRGYISEYTNDQVAVVAFGDQAIPGSKTVAESVSQAWHRGGVDAARRLEGCFSAVILDLKRGAIYVVSDIMGRRTLRYFNNSETILISTHDIPVIATGLCPVEYNLESACSIVGCDWSLLGRSLIKKIDNCDPHEYVVWQNGELKQVYKPLITPENRIDAKDSKSILHRVDSIIEKIRASAREFCAQFPVITIDLTAGMDSRTVLGLVLSVAESSHIRAQTAGSVNNFEVQMAQKLSRYYKINHEYHLPNTETATVDSFLDYSKWLAFLANGDTNSKRATNPLPDLTTKPIPKCDGGGGEIYRGYYYPHPFSKQAIGQFSPDDIIKLLEKKFSRIKTLPWSIPDFPDSIRLRLKEIVYAHVKISSQPSDLLDLFYIYERYGRWGSWGARSVFWFNGLSLFASPTVARMAFELPAPISNNVLLHKTIIKRYLPRAYYWPINKTSLLPFMGDTKTKIFAQKTYKRFIGRWEQLRNVLKSGDSLKTHEQVRADLFAQSYGDIFQDLLLCRDSIATIILHRSKLEEMLKEHISGQKNHLQALGFLITIEQWRNLIEEAKRLSQNV